MKKAFILVQCNVGGLGHHLSCFEIDKIRQFFEDVAEQNLGFKLIQVDSKACALVWRGIDAPDSLELIPVIRGYSEYIPKDLEIVCKRDFLRIRDK